MADTLEVFGVEYTGVTGIKATDDSDVIKTYTAGAPDPLDSSWPSGVVTSNLTRIPGYSCYKRTGVTEIHAENATSFASGAFWGCSASHIYLPNANGALYGNQFFRECTNLVSLALPSATNAFYAYSFYGDTALESVDFVTTGLAQVEGFRGCSKLTTIVLRHTSVVTLGNVNWFTGTPFASGGAGGTIYVPSDLISSYQAATNWSTLDGYGTVTWAAIEGSQYENYYADGTAIT